MQSRIEQRVMAGVGVIYTARLMLSRTALEVYVLAASAVALWQFTWVHRVFQNWANVGIAGTWQFVSYAFLHTHLPVQVALIVAAAAGLALVVDTVRSFAAPRARFAH